MSKLKAIVIVTLLLFIANQTKAQNAKEDKFNNRQDALDILISAKSMGFNSYMRAVI